VESSSEQGRNANEGLLSPKCVALEALRILELTARWGCRAGAQDYVSAPAAGKCRRWWSPSFFGKERRIVEVVGADSGSSLESRQIRCGRGGVTAKILALRREQPE
jgi:hypothetical protein